MWYRNLNNFPALQMDQNHSNQPEVILFKLILNKWVVFKIKVSHKMYIVIAMIYLELLLWRYTQNMDDFQPCEYPELPVSDSMLCRCFYCFVSERMLLGKKSWFGSALYTLQLHGSSSAPPKAGLELCGALAGLSYRSRIINSTPVPLPHHISLIMDILQQEIFF